MKKLLLWFMLMFVSCSFALAADLDGDLVLHYKFNGSSLDSSGNAINLSYYINGTAGYDFAMYRNAEDIFLNSIDGVLHSITFDDQGAVFVGLPGNSPLSSYINLSDSDFDFVNDLSVVVEASANVRKVQFLVHKFGDSVGYYFGLYSTGLIWSVTQIGGGTDKTTNSNTGIYGVGAFHQYAYVVQENKNATLYYDGSEVVGYSQRNAAESGSYENNFKLRLGIDADGFSNPFNGSMRRVFIYDRVLHPDEVESLYVGGNFTDGFNNYINHSIFLNGIDNYFLTHNFSDSFSAITVMYWVKNVSGWFHIVNSSDTFYVNGIAGGDKDMFSHFWDGEKLRFGNSDSVQIASLRIYNSSLDAAEVLSIYQTENETGAAVAGIVIHSINLTDEQGNFLDSSEFLEHQDFFVTANVTVDDLQTDDLSCNFSAINISFHGDSRGDAFTLTDTNSFEFSFDEGSSDTISENFEFRVCALNAAKNVQVYVNDNSTPYLTVDSSVIPSCPNLFALNNISTFSATDQVNVSVRCSGCVGVNQVNISEFSGTAGSDVLFEWHREFSFHSEDLVFNVSSNRFNFLDHLYAFEFLGSASVEVSCNDTADSLSVNLGDVLPVVEIVELNGVSFVNASTLESGINVSVLCIAFNDSIVSRNVSVAFSNGSILAVNTSDLFLQMDSGLFVIDDNYTISCAAVDDEGSITTETGIFQVLDTVSPAAVWFAPDNDNVTEVAQNSTQLIQILFSDVNLFGINVSCSHNILGNVFDFLYLDISGSSFFLNNVTDNLTIVGTVSCIVEYCDDHTMGLFDDYSVSTDRFKRNVTLNDRVIVSDASSYDVRDISFIQRRDRLSWCYEYDTFEDFYKEKRYLYKILKGEGWIYRGSFMAHYASWDSKYWLDLVPAYGVDFRIDRIEEDADYFIVHALSMDNLVCFDSIGDLNCREDVVTFDVVIPEPPEGERGIQDITTGEGLFFLILAIVWICFMLGGLALNVPFISLFGAGIGVLCGVLWLPFNVTAGIVTIIVNIFGAFGIMSVMK